MKRIEVTYQAEGGAHGEPILFLLQTFPELSQDSVGFHFYEASHLLAVYLARNIKPVMPLGAKRVLELGSGSCGLAGLAMSRLNFNVTFTDLPIILPYLQLNVDRNLRADMKPFSSVQHLAWGNENAKDEDDEEKHFDYIVAADCTYVRASIIPFVQTIVQHLAKRGECYVSHEVREHGLDAYFEDQAKQFGLRVRKIKPSAFPGPFSEGDQTHLKLYKLVKI